MNANRMIQPTKSRMLDTAIYLTLVVLMAVSTIVVSGTLVLASTVARDCGAAG